MRCLFTSDYGSPDPSFNPFAEGGKLLQGYEGHVYELSHAQNLGQLLAMERKLQRGEEIQWCDQGYGWVYEPGPTQFFEIVLAGIVLPYVLFRALPALLRRFHRGDAASNATVSGASPSRGAAP